MIEIKGQPISFSETTCYDFCLTLAKSAVSVATDFCFQIPLFDTGGNLLAATVSFDNVNDVKTGAPEGGYPPVTAVCGSSNNTTFNAVAQATTIGENGFYFMKYAIDAATITWAETPLVAPHYADAVKSKNMFLRYSVDANDEYIRFNEATLTGGIKSGASLTMTSGNSILMRTNADYELDTSTGICRLVYVLDGITSDFTKMFDEQTYTATDDTFYRLKFTSANATSITVTITDSASVEIYKNTSDGVGFDKVFKTGTLPGGKVLTVRYEIDQFIEFESTAYYTDVIVDVTLIKQCRYEVDLETNLAVNVITLTETHDTTVEATGVSYNQNIQYCVDLNDGSISPGCFQFRATDQCTPANQEVSNCVNICEASCTDGLTKLSWDHSNIKSVGDYSLDNENYTYTSFFFIKMDLQDMTMEEEREVYIGSDGFYNVAFSMQQETEILQIWNAPNFLRRAIATAMMDTFFIDGIEYTKVDSDEFAPQFTASLNSPMRLSVHRVGAHTISRNI